MKKSYFLLLTLVLLMGAIPAYAYVDASTGSMLLQLVTAGVGGILVATKLMWKRLWTRKPKGTSEPEKSDTPHV